MQSKTSFSSTTMDYDASLYSRVYHLNKSARKHKQDFIQRFASLIKWNNGEDLVMDVGCGPGDITHKDLLPAIPEGKTIIAIDLQPDMIDFARLHNFHPKIEYHVADIAKLITLEKWIGKISHIFSIHCLHRVKDQETAFKNIFSLLKENGEAVLLLVLREAASICYDDIINSPKWKKIVEATSKSVPKSHPKAYGGDYYKDFIEEIGFEVLVCEDTYKEFTFETDDLGKDCLASHCLFTTGIPEELKEEFKTDLCEIFVKHYGRDTENRAQGKIRLLALHLRKPVEYST